MEALSRKRKGEQSFALIWMVVVGADGLEPPTYAV
jgi:hypothetical protein